MNLSLVLDTIEQHKRTLHTFGLTRIGIFGSLATGTATPASDIDILLDFDPKQKTYRNFFQSTSYLEQILRRPVDVLTPQSLSRQFHDAIAKDITYVKINK
ncbi:nucleotidyltransferase family protein [Candidatus Gottesmanbacteria bacterium]|nr:nucleotidyltransferase family protein [Candidatus Gottesmanbacteria bacterium]